MFPTKLRKCARKTVVHGKFEKILKKYCFSLGIQGKDIVNNIAFTSAPLHLNILFTIPYPIMACFLHALPFLLQHKYVQHERIRRSKENQT